MRTNGEREREREREENKQAQRQERKINGETEEVNDDILG